MLRRGIALSLAALTAFLVPQALAASDRSVESDTGTIAGTDRTVVDAECRSGSHATGAGFAWTPISQSDLLTSPTSIYPLDGLREWFVYFDNESATSRQARVFVLCREGKRLAYKVKEYPNLDGDTDQTPTLTAKCPRGTSVAGGGATIAGDALSSAITATRPTSGRVWRTDMFLYDDNTHYGYAIAMCDPDHRYSQATKTEQADSFPRARRTNFDTVSATAKCPNGSTTTSGGFELDSFDPNGSPLASFPKGKDKWTASARYGGATDPTVTSYAVCRKD